MSLHIILESYEMNFFCFQQSSEEFLESYFQSELSSTQKRTSAGDVSSTNVDALAANQENDFGLSDDSLES